MRTARVDTLEMASPEDVSGLSRCLDDGLAVEAIKAILIKSEGNGLDNDFSRRLAVRATLDCLADRAGTLQAAVARGVTILASGGTEGIITPHMTLYSVLDDGAAATRPSLAIGRAEAAAVPAGDLVGAPQSAAIEDATRDAMSDAGLDAQDVAFVVVKGALPGASALASLGGASAHSLKPAMRAASALGVALALGEASGDAADDPEAVCRRACVTAAADRERSEVVVFGTSPDWAGPYAVASGVLADMLDASGVAAICERLGMRPSPQLSGADQGRVAAVILKGDAPQDDMVRGRRHVMNRDSDIDRNRHYRAAMGGLVGAITAETRLYTSAGAERQAPPGGAVIAIFARQPT